MNNFRIPSFPKIRMRGEWLVNLRALLIFFMIIVFPAGGGEEEIESRNQIYELVKGLNNSYQIRQKFVNQLVAIADTKNRDLLMSQLAFGLTLDNIQIREGLVEIYSRINNPSVIPLLHNEVLYNAALDVRRSVIYHLPLFYVRDRRSRDEIRDFYEQRERFLSERLLRYLRELPLDDDGKFNHLRDKLRQEIESIITEQLEPVGATMQYLETTYHSLAYAQLKRFLGVDLGSNKNKWLEFWRGRGRTFVSPLQDELFDTQVTATEMLAVLGAEGTPQLCEQLRWLSATPFPTLRAAAWKMLSELLTRAALESRLHNAALAKGVADQSEEIWRKRRLDAAQRLFTLTFEIAQRYLTADASLANLLLIDCLGATRDARAMKFLRVILRSGKTAFQLSQHLAAAFGKIGDAETVKLLAMMLDYQGIAVEREEQVREFQRVRSATQALAVIAGEIQNGEFVVQNPETAAEALELLLRQIADSRGIIGAPDHGRIQTVQYITRQILNEQWHCEERSYNPEVWRDHYQRLAANSLKN